LNTFEDRRIVARASSSARPREEHRFRGAVDLRALMERLVAVVSKEGGHSPAGSGLRNEGQK